MAPATTSRGARSPCGCTPAVTESPRASTKMAPSPRTASLIRGRHPAASGVCSIVGWNWMNSMSATDTPARNANAMPSPVDPSGLVVAEYRCPSPPVARTTAPAWITPSPSLFPTSTPPTPSGPTRMSCTTWLRRTSSIAAA
ncbi:Uncharacterised protein [Mycobacteroides abscessus subsp. abscessus]|nr:Uncharacterised protein [Mycobacteroides abscessus subsp. abscessus]